MPKLKVPRIRKINWVTVIAILSYLHILVLVPILLSKKNNFIYYHAKQGAALMVVWVVALFTFYLPAIFWLFFLYIAICIIYGIVNVFLGREKPLPLIGRWAEKI